MGMALPGQHSKAFVQGSGLVQMEFESATQTLLFQVQVYNSITGKHVVVVYDFSNGHYPTTPCSSRAIHDDERPAGLWSLRSACDGQFYVSTPDAGIERWNISAMAAQVCAEDQASDPCPYTPPKVHANEKQRGMYMVEPSTSKPNGMLVYGSDSTNAGGKSVWSSNLDGTSPSRQVSALSSGSNYNMAYASNEDVLVVEISGNKIVELSNFSTGSASFASAKTLVSGVGEDTRANTDWRRGTMPIHVVYIQNSEWTGTTTTSTPTTTTTTTLTITTTTTVATTTGTTTTGTTTTT